MENIKLVDCFSYFNEKEILEFRIKLLYDHVDAFVITEANHTHSGILKEYECEKILSLIDDPLNKINLVKIDFTNCPNYGNWDRERTQRDSIYQILHKFDDDCLFYFGDCDEILNPEHIEWIKHTSKSNPENILRTPLAFLNCKANLRVFDVNGDPISWDCPFVASKRHLGIYTPSQIRESSALKTNNIQFSDIKLTLNNTEVILGWHFSWMGGNNRMKEKFKSYLHSNDFDKDEINNYISSYKPEENSSDPLGREDHILKEYPIEFLPKIIFEYDKFRNFFIESIFEEEKIDFLLNEVGKNSNYNWKDHKDFATWIVRKIKPEVIVDLGVDYGYSTFCFAIPKIGKIYGIDSFEGDKHAGMRNTYDFVLEKIGQFNFNNIQIIKGYFDDVNKTWMTPIDILHIDGLHTYEAVKNDFSNWFPHVKENGIILFHDTEVDNPDFGVRRFFDEINMPKVNFFHSNGLGVVSREQSIIDEIKKVYSRYLNVK